MSDAYDVLGIAPAFDVDVSEVERAWLRRTALLHPDRSSDPAAAAREMALVNAARSALLDDERRANVLLERLGGASKEKDNSLPDGFLVEIFELRQEIEEITGSGERERAEDVEREAGRLRSGYVARVGEMFRGAGLAPAPEQLSAIRRELNAWRYIERLIEQLRDAPA